MGVDGAAARGRAASAARRHGVGAGDVRRWPTSSVYLALLAEIGPEALAVTTNASFDFLRKPAAGADLLCDCRLLKLGRVLAVGDCLLRSEGQEAPVARATLTYSIPPKRA